MLLCTLLFDLESFGSIFRLLSSATFMMSSLIHFSSSRLLLCWHQGDSVWSTSCWLADICWRGLLTIQKQQIFMPFFHNDSSHASSPPVALLFLPGCPLIWAMFNEFTKSQTFLKTVVHVFVSRDLFWYSAGVFRDTPHESLSKYHIAVIPSVTRTYSP